MRYFLLCFPVLLWSVVKPGIECFFQQGYAEKLKGKKVALVTNYTARDKDLSLTVDKCLNACFTLEAIWTPEHGLTGTAYAGAHVNHSKYQNIPVISLHGDTRRPKLEHLKNIHTIIYDIQDIGVRSYTYAATLLYVMEAASQHKIPVIVLDRPNPMGGLLIDGPMLNPEMRSFVGYLNVPYCHGMTIGELARYYNSEYQISCDLTVVPMEGWRRDMTFSQTGLTWIPTSPNMPEPDTPIYCATTGILGELGMVNIGIGYTMPFKLVGAPWINAESFAKALNDQKLGGVKFLPFHYRPFYGLYKGQDCHGVYIDITNLHLYRPLSTQYMIIGMLKSLYPKIFNEALSKTPKLRKDLFCQVNGNREILEFLTKERFPAWKCMAFQQKERQDYIEKRKKYLLY